MEYKTRYEDIPGWKDRFSAPNIEPDFALIDITLRDEAAKLLQDRSEWDYSMARWYANDYDNAHGTYAANIVESVKRSLLADIIARQSSAARASLAARKLMGVA